jgi:hypothetical protein
MLEKLFAKRHIEKLDLGPVRAKAVEKLGWSQDQAARVEGDYKRFLYALAHRREGEILSPPSQEVDEFWHQHILNTKKYREDCQTVFGHYVDHTPGLDAERQRKADERRRQVYAQYNIDDISFVSFDSGDSRRSRHGGGFDGGGCSGSGDSGHSHSSHGAHGHHDAGSTHGGDSSAHESGHAGDSGGHGGDAGGHGGDSGGSGDGGGSDGGGGCGGGCGGG